MQYSKTVFVLFLFSIQNQYAQFTDEINSNRPGKSMMAFSVGKSVIQAETGLNYVSENHTIQKYKTSGFNADLDIRWGLFFEELELIGEFQYQTDKLTSNYLNTNRSALRKTIFGAKYLIYDPFKNYEEKENLYSWKANHRMKWRQFLPAFSAYAGVNLNFSDNPFDYAPIAIIEPTVSPKAMLIAQNHFGARWVMVTNLAYNKIGTKFSSIDYIITVTRGFNAQWSGFIENQGYNGTYYKDGVLRLGAAYLIGKDMQVDASFGTSFKSSPKVFNAGIGFSWRFAENYQEVKMEKDNGSKMDKKMKKKGEKEAKKRKDEVVE